MRIGLVIPCRNEAAILERKLANLRILCWPEGNHELVIVDDGSEDGTAELAQRIVAERPISNRVRVQVLVNEDRPGKPGALRTGITAVEARVDLIGCSDADVLLGETALVRMVEAFQRDADLQMACGAQVFVGQLPETGVVDEVQLERRSDAYDCWTGRWRAVESRFGSLFSVHGQLLVWRRGLQLKPSYGIAADDLDLMAQLRASRPQGSIRLIREARFFERKTPAGEWAQDQAVRRARAYVQFVNAWTVPDGLSLGRALQWHAYRHLPLAAPWVTLCGVFVTLALAALWSATALALTALLFGALFVTSTGRVWLRSMQTIRIAKSLERKETLPERWEMARHG